MTETTAKATKEATAKKPAKPAPRPRTTVMMSKAEIAKLPPLRIPTASGPPPRHLQIIDLRKGSKRRATKTDAVTIRFIEDTYPEALAGKQGGLSDGVAHWESWPPGEVSTGIHLGLPGMKVGGRREMIVPPQVAYAGWKPSWGYAPFVSVYVVDLLGVEP